MSTTSQIRKIAVKPNLSLSVEVPDAADKPVVLLSNSVGSSMSLWDETVSLLADRLCFIRYDTRGHGASDVANEPSALADLGRDAIAILDALKVPRAVFCGVSLGGLTGQWLGIHAQDRLHGLVIANSAANFPPPSMWKERAATVRADGMGPMVPITIDRWFTKAFQQAQPQRMEDFRRMIGATPPEGYAACCEILGAADLLPELPAIACPVHVICGAHDPSTPPARGEEIAAAVQNGSVVTLDAAHISPVEAAQAFADELLAFVEKVSA